ncbi:hypothetical protein B484DRAFT_473639, partial [Ochromonadaceae sp. CCMP2298]
MGCRGALSLRDRLSCRLHEVHHLRIGPRRPNLLKSSEDVLIHMVRWQQRSDHVARPDQEHLRSDLVVHLGGQSDVPEAESTVGLISEHDQLCGDEWRKSSNLVAKCPSSQLSASRPYGRDRYGSHNLRRSVTAFSTFGVSELKSSLRLCPVHSLCSAVSSLALLDLCVRVRCDCSQSAVSAVRSHRSRSRISASEFAVTVPSPQSLQCSFIARALVSLLHSKVFIMFNKSSKSSSRSRSPLSSEAERDRTMLTRPSGAVATRDRTPDTDAAPTALVLGSRRTTRVNSGIAPARLETTEIQPYGAQAKAAKVTAAKRKSVSKPLEVGKFRAGSKSPHAPSIKSEWEDVMLVSRALGQLIPFHLFWRTDVGVQEAVYQLSGIASTDAHGRYIMFCYTIAVTNKMIPCATSISRMQEMLMEVVDLVQVNRSLGSASPRRYPVPPEGMGAHPFLDEFAISDISLPLLASLD